MANSNYALIMLVLSANTKIINKLLLYKVPSETSHQFQVRQSVNIANGYQLYKLPFEAIC